jgi:hypothetical protein
MTNRKKRLKMLRLRRFWPTLACTIPHDSSKTNDANAEQTESMVDDDVEQNDVSQNIIQGLQKETVSDDVEMEKADETTDATSGHVNRDCDDRIDEENTIIDQGKDLTIQGGVELNDATLMEGDLVIIGEQNIVQDGLTFMQDLLTAVDFNNDEDQASNSEEVEWNMMVLMVPQIIQKSKMIPQIHLPD